MEEERRRAVRWKGGARGNIEWGGSQVTQEGGREGGRGLGQRSDAECPGHCLFQSLFKSTCVARVSYGLNIGTDEPRRARQRLRRVSRK